jgi:hypothetical protein
MIPGFKSKITSTGIFVRTTHYSADSRKRPGTTDGDQWLKEEARAYPMGMDDPRWLKEMEIKYTAMGGQYLFPRLEKWKTESQIFIKPFIPTGYKLYASYDHGWSTPAAFHVHAMDSMGKFKVGVFEFYASKVPVHQIAEVMKGNAITTKDGRRFEGCPWTDWTFCLADPSIFREDHPQDDGPNRSTAKIFRECGIPMVAAERGGDLTVAEWLHGHFWADIQNPLLQVVCPEAFLQTPPKNKEFSGMGAPMLTWELGQQRHKEFSSQVALSRNQPEDLVDKDNHAFDGLKYFLNRFPPKPRDKIAEKRPNTFLWWKKIGQREMSGSDRPSFKIGS